ncbi:MAG: DUF1697 domain-containing protein [Mycolicibacterium sp.]|uniref:DUF1697 domain-containing protein n=1 Tax=Mycolicibacterium sp. TaxID=2320850 RepID=UPI003D1397E4
MTRYAVFLRGVNVAGISLKMSAVARALEGAGFANVKTILASGNVLLESRLGAAAVRSKIEETLRAEFGYDAWVLVYEVDELAQIAVDYPFEREVDGHHSYVTLVSDADVLRELSALAESAATGEKIQAGRAALYWQVPRAATLESTIGKTMGKKRYKSSTTTRNLRTIDRVLRG